MSYSVKPGRGPSFIGGLMGLIIGVPFMIFWISTAPEEMKLFGILGLFAAIGVGVYNLYNAGVGPRDRISEHEIVRGGEKEGDEGFGTDFSPLPDTESRLKELESLRAKGLITQAEFERKRESIIAEI